MVIQTILSRYNMYNINLPYSKQAFIMPMITFRQLFNLSRLLYDNDVNGYISVLEDTFKLHGLCIIDKLYVIIKARQFYINESVSLNVDGKVVNVNVCNFAKELYNVENRHQIITLNNQQVEIDLPYRILTKTNASNIYENIIRSISIGDNTIELYNASIESIQSILEVLPPTLIKHLKQFVVNQSNEVEIFSNKTSNKDNLTVNLVTSQPFELIKLLLNDYDLMSFREILFSLSKRMNSETILNSPINDVMFYLEQYREEIKQNNNSGINSIGI